MVVILTLMVAFLLLLLGLVLLAESQSGTTLHRVVWFDALQSDRQSSVRDVGPFKERIDWFTTYGDEALTNRIGEYMINRYDYEVPGYIYQLGKASFFFPDGTITMDVSLNRPSQGDPAVLDPGAHVVYPIIAGTRAYSGIQGTITFDVTGTLRRATIDGRY